MPFGGVQTVNVKISNTARTMYSAVLKYDRMSNYGTNAKLGIFLVFPVLFVFVLSFIHMHVIISGSELLE